MTLEVRAQPRSGVRGIWKNPQGEIRIRLHSAPESGKANNELVALVADWLNVPRSKIEIWKGAKARQKVLRIQDFDSQSLQDAVGKLQAK